VPQSIVIEKPGVEICQPIKSPIGSVGFKVEEGYRRTTYSRSVGECHWLHVSLYTFWLVASGREE
jgi:hypothetical protein